jgi:hypothetical protein
MWGGAAHHRHFVNGTRRESLVYFTIGFPAEKATLLASLINVDVRRVVIAYLANGGIETNELSFYNL